MIVAIMMRILVMSKTTVDNRTEESQKINEKMIVLSVLQEGWIRIVNAEIKRCT